MKIHVSSDHAGFELRRILVSALRDRGFAVEDLGPQEATPCNYPDEAERVGRAVVADPGSRGLLVCGSGIGMCIAANRLNGVRAVDAWNVESARLSRAHNDANVLCLGGRLISHIDARSILDVWLSTDFDGGRHAERIADIDQIGQIGNTARNEQRSEESNE